MTGVDVLRERWYAHPNDLIGGWCVLNRDYPPSRFHRDVDPDAREVGTFLGEAVARHIVELHNAALAGEPARPATLAAAAVPGPLPTVEICRPDDDHLEVLVDGETVASANYDEHGSSGMAAVERAAVAVAYAFGVAVGEAELEAGELCDLDEVHEPHDDCPGLEPDPCPKGDPDCETGDDGSCHDACEPPGSNREPRNPALPDGLCGNRDDHEPHDVHGAPVGDYRCTADQATRLPYAAERQRREAAGR